MSSAQEPPTDERVEDTHEASSTKKEKRKKKRERSKSSKSSKSKSSRKASEEASRDSSTASDDTAHTSESVLSPRKSKGAHKSSRSTHKRKTSKKKSGRRWKHIPRACHALIFCHFTLADLPRVTLVCRQWRELYYHHVRQVNFREFFTRRHAALLSDALLRERLLRFQSVEILWLSQCEQLSDETVESLLAQGMPSLRSLAVDHCTRLTDRSLVPMRQLPALEELCVAACENVTATGLQRLLTALPRLRRLDVSFLPVVTDRSLIALEDAPALEALNVACTSVTGPILELLPLTLTELSLYGGGSRLHICTATDYLRRFHLLRFLDISYCDPPAPVQDRNAWIVEDMIPYVAKLPAMEGLVARAVSLSDRSLECISHMPRLQFLDISKSHGYSLDGLGCLTECASLQRLDVTACLPIYTRKAIEFLLLYFGHLRDVYLPTGVHFRDYQPGEELEELEEEEEESEAYYDVATGHSQYSGDDSDEYFAHSDSDAT